MKFYEDAGIRTAGRKITNHSGHVTCASTLYNAGFDDKAVTSRTFHKSNAVQVYKRESANTLQKISNALAPPKPSTFKFKSPQSNTVSSPKNACSHDATPITESDTDCKEQITPATVISTHPEDTGDNRNLTICVPLGIDLITIWKKNNK